MAKYYMLIFLNILGLCFSPCTIGALVNDEALVLAVSAGSKGKCRIWYQQKDGKRFFASWECRTTAGVGMLQNAVEAKLFSSKVVVTLGSIGNGTSGSGDPLKALEVTR